MVKSETSFRSFLLRHLAVPVNQINQSVKLTELLSIVGTVLIPILKIKNSAQFTRHLIADPGTDSVVLVRAVQLCSFGSIILCV